LPKHSSPSTGKSWGLNGNWSNHGAILCELAEIKSKLAMREWIATSGTVDDLPVMEQLAHSQSRRFSPLKADRTDDFDITRIISCA
jgi:hypothetical protein